MNRASGKESVFDTHLDLIIMENNNDILLGQTIGSAFLDVQGQYLGKTGMSAFCWPLEMKRKGHVKFSYPEILRIKSSLEKRKMALKLHKQFSHPSSQKMVSLVTSFGVNFPTNIVH